MSPRRSPEIIVSVAVPAPVRQLFDYRVQDAPPLPGCRVIVPFGAGRRVGVAVQVTRRRATRELKHVERVLDREPVLGAPLTALLRWAADYYHHPIGEVFQASLPTRMRKALPTPREADLRHRLLVAADDALASLKPNATRQRRVVERLAASAPEVRHADLVADLGACGDALARLRERGIIESFTKAHGPPPVAGPGLNPRQRAAVEAARAALGRYRAFLLRGVTGSGKTEVYLESARRAIESGLQVLVLVPEIALTSQLVARFRQRLGGRLATMHSALGAGERQRAWRAAAGGDADVVLGTRSAVFSELPRLGLIVVDEEHDASYKQHEGFRYHARDVAVKRAAMQGVPVVLGSATPSLETWGNARRGRYTLLELPTRARGVGLPEMRLVDLRHWPRHEGLSPPLVHALAERLERGEQSLVFINRRGFAPLVMCGKCGWQARCGRCDAYMTLHKRAGQMRCHHCGAAADAPPCCPACGGERVFFAGIGTQRAEQALAARFPAARVLRIDRDNSSAKGVLDEKLERVREREVDILVGTQMLSKGHDFPGITLVCVLNGDQGMFSVDFRAAERLFQSVTQVAGRAGRGARGGEVLIQTDFADHPTMLSLATHDYVSFADRELAARRVSELPPFSFLALARAESTQREHALAFLRLCKTLAESGARGVEVMDPVPAPMERRAGRTRAQLLLQSTSRAALGAVLTKMIERACGDRLARRVRWSVDVDPVDLY